MRLQCQGVKELGRVKGHREADEVDSCLSAIPHIVPSAKRTPKIYLPQCSSVFKVFNDGYPKEILQSSLSSSPTPPPSVKSLQCKHAFSIIAREVEFGRLLYNYSVESPKP